MTDLINKTALVTGASRGIGRDIAIAFAREGLNVAVHYRERSRDAHETAAAISALGRRAVVVQGDLSRASDVSRVVEETVSALGPIAVVVNNAGVTRPQPVEAITERDFDDLIAINLKSAFVVTQAVLPAMRAAKWGRIINLSSVAAQLGGIVGPHYAASKAGLIGLTHGYAAMLAKIGRAHV